MAWEKAASLVALDAPPGVREETLLVLVLSGRAWLRDALTALKFSPVQQGLLLRLLAAVLHLGNVEFTQLQDATLLCGAGSEAALQEAARLLAFEGAEHDGPSLLLQTLTSRAIRDVRKPLTASQAKAARDAAAKVGL